MFDFFYELFGEAKRENYRYQVDEGKKIAVEGYKNVLKIDENNIVIKLARSELNIEGENLKVKELLKNTIVITGRIISVCEVLKNEK